MIAAWVAAGALVCAVVMLTWGISTLRTNRDTDD